jgi:hypothetical protein
MKQGIGMQPLRQQSEESPLDGTIVASDPDQSLTPAMNQLLAAFPEQTNAEIEPGATALPMQELEQQDVTGGAYVSNRLLSHSLSEMGYLGQQRRRHRCAGLAA